MNKGSMSAVGSVELLSQFGCIHITACVLTSYLSFAVSRTSWRNVNYHAPLDYVCNYVFLSDGCFRSGVGDRTTEDKRSHLSLNVQVITLLSASTTTGLRLWAAVFTFVFTTIRRTLRSAVIQVSSAPGHLRVVSTCSAVTFRITHPCSDTANQAQIITSCEICASPFRTAPRNIQMTQPRQGRR